MSAPTLARTMAAVEAALSSGSPSTRPEAVKVGVDLGTAYTVVTVLDEHDRPLAVAYERADVVRDGVVVDFIGAVDVVRRLKADVESRLAGNCRLLVRYSGTEPLLRVMLEGPDQQRIREWAEEIAEEVRRQIG